MTLRSMSLSVSGVILAAALLGAGCAGRPIPVAIQPPFDVPKSSPEEGHVREVLAAIEKRNLEVERQQGWSAKAYSAFMIKGLQEVDESEYERYAQYLDHGAVYIIVHPAYYTFFHEINGQNDYVPAPARNAVDLLIEEPTYSSKKRLQIVQEKAMRDFLEYASTDKKLVVLVLPKDYRRYAGYKFRGGSDEFVRYINEVTNASGSVLYIYSKRANRGTLTENDRRMLLKFLYGIKTKEILIGGGYIGRCIEDFYKDIEQYYSEDKLYIVPELTAISPADLSSGAASDMLNDDGMVDIGKLSRSIQTNALGNQNIAPKVRNLRTRADAPQEGSVVPGAAENKQDQP